MVREWNETELNQLERICCIMPKQIGDRFAELLHECEEDLAESAVRVFDNLATRDKVRFWVVKDEHITPIMEALELIDGWGYRIEDDIPSGIDKPCYKVELLE